MSDNVIIDGIKYRFDDTGRDHGNGCWGCASTLDNPNGGDLCDRFPGCTGGVWCIVEAKA